MTRLHSNRMHTARALTVAHSMLCAGGCTWGECLLPGGCLLRGVSTSWSTPGGWGCTWSLVGSAPGGSTGGCTWSWADLVPGGCLLKGGVPGWGGLLLKGCTWSWGVSLHGGVCSQGGTGPGGYLVWRVHLVGGCRPLGGSAPWGQVYLVPGGLHLVLGGAPAQVLPLPTVNRILHTHLWKYYLAPDFVCGR